MIDPKSNLQIFEPKQIKEASLQYCHDLLNTRKNYEEYQKYYFIQDMIHIIRSAWDKYEDEDIITKEDFDKRY